MARRKTYHTGQTVQESWFAAGEFDRLIKAGHLNPVAGEEPAQEEPKQDPPKVDPPKQDPPNITAGQEGDDGKEDESEEKEDESELTIGQLRSTLKERGIPFKPTDKKEDLIKLLSQG